MADFQTKVNIYPAVGVPGAFASVNPIVSTSLGRIAGADVPIGGFCWDDPSNEGEVLPSGTGKPLGFVCRDVIYPIASFDPAQNFVPEGCTPCIMVEGDFYVQPEAAVTKGQKVFANLTTGAVSGGAAGATVSGSVETDWAFATGAEAGGIAIITNYGATRLFRQLAHKGGHK